MLIHGRSPARLAALRSREPWSDSAAVRVRLKAYLFSRRERVRSGAGGGQWELKIDARRQRTWEIHAALSAMEHPFAPCSVTWNGKPLAEGDWSYDEATATLQARVTARRGRLLVTACD